MKMLVFLVMALWSSGICQIVPANFCPIYECKGLNGVTDPNNFTCGAFNITNPKQILFEECPEQMLCNYIGWNRYKENTTICQPEDKVYMDLPPGEVCSQNSQCYSNMCEQHVCQATAAEGIKCENSIECNVGLLCNSTTKICQLLPDVGQKCYGFCQTYATCVFGTCVYKYSMPIGALVPSSSFHSACLTGFSGTDTEGRPRCMQGAKLDGYSEDSPIRKNYGDMCNYTLFSNKTKIQRMSICGFSSTNQTFCKPGFGNFPEEFKQLREYAEKKPKCHQKSNGFAGFICGGAYKDQPELYLKAFIAMSKVAAYENFIETPPCMKTVFPLNEYFVAQKDLKAYSDAGGALKNSFLLFLLSLILMF